MKNKFNFLIVIAIMVFVIGCSCGRFAEFGSSKDAPKEKSPTTSEKNTTNDEGKNLDDKAIDTVVGEESTGIPECDELMAFFEKEAKNPDDDYITKATKQFFFNKIKETFKEDFEKNKDNKPQMSKNCKQYLEQLKNFKTEDSGKSKEAK